MDEKDFEGFARRIDQIDRILEEPARYLIRKTSPSNGKLQIPSFLSDEFSGDPVTPLVQSIHLSTLQRLWVRRRRFPRIEKHLYRLEEDWQNAGGKDAEDARLLQLLSSPIAGGCAPSSRDFSEYVKLVTHPELGKPDPYTASQVFRVLLNAGEKYAHTRAGFFSFFSTLWAIHSSFPDGGGVALGRCYPTAFVTAKCLGPLFILIRICRRRAQLLQELKELIESTSWLMSQSWEGVKQRKLPFRLDEIATKLYDLSGIVVAPSAFLECAKKTVGLAAKMPSELNGDSRSKPDQVWRDVLVSLADTFKQLGKAGEEALEEAGRLVAQLGSLPDLLMDRNNSEIARIFGFEVDAPWHGDATQKHWEDISHAAAEAEKICRDTHRALTEACQQCGGLPSLNASELRNKEEIDEPQAELYKAIELMAVKHRDNVAEAVRRSMDRAIFWCEKVMTREIAHASARNITDFDPSELVSALTVSIHAGRIVSPLRVEDALRKAMLGRRSDGSWAPGQPFFMKETLGLSASTSSIIWGLSECILRFPGIRVADSALGSYVDWLERTRVTLKSGNASGWVSERALRPRRVDTMATDLAVNALLGIREIMEYRIWEECRDRFTVLEEGRRLRDIDAVDLGSRHEYRLHRKLAKIARLAEGDDYKRAEYSLILHGPPGSSKTAITNALASEMWRSHRQATAAGRLIRITPADFTRKGEDRLDSEARLIFDLLSRVRRVTILFDEIDDLLKVRSFDDPPNFMKLVVPAMLNRLQDLRDACERQEICFVLATNYVDRIEPALIRKGRIDRAIPVVYPDRDSRLGTLDRHLLSLQKRDEEWVRWALEFMYGERFDLSGILRETDFWPFQSFDSLCRTMVESLEFAGRVDDGCQGEDELRKREDEFKKNLSAAQEKYKPANARSIYAQRMETLRSSTELVEELLQYHLAGVGDEQEFLKILAENIETTRKNLGARLGFSGQQFEAKLAAIRGARGWAGQSPGKSWGRWLRGQRRRRRDSATSSKPTSRRQSL